MKKFFRKIHLWLSIPFGLIISAICISGAALVFETEITELCYPDRYRVAKAEGQPLPMDGLLEMVAKSLSDSVTITGVTVPSDPERAYQVSLSKPRRSSVYVDQYTGEIKGKSQRGAFFTFMFKMHRWLLDSMKPDGGIFVGKIVVGVSTLLFVIILISGIVIWLPRTRAALKNRLKISTGKGWRRFWYDLHVSGGIYATLLLLAMALTGLTWSFPWYRTAFYKVFGVEVLQQAHHGGQKQGDKTFTQNIFTHWQEVYNRLSLQNPDFKQINVTDGTAKVSFDRYGNQRASDSYTFNPQNGKITETKLYAHQDKSGKMRGWIYSVHVGSWGGLSTRILTFIAALLGGALPLTGYYLWLKRSVLNKRKKKTA